MSLNSITLIAEREVRMRVRSKAFIISTALLVFLVVAGIVAGGFFGGGNAPQTTRTVAVLGEAASAVDPHEQLIQVPVQSLAEAEELVRSGEVDAAIVPDAAAGNILGIKVLAMETPNTVMGLLSASPPLEILAEADADYFLAYFVAIGFGVLFMMAAITFGTAIAQSVVEEKQTRIVELLLSTVSARVLLAGKLIGNTLLAFGQIALLAAAAGVALALTGQGAILTAVGMPVLWFVLFFTIGFVLLAAMFSALAALVSRMEDVNGVVAPVTYLIMFPYVGVILFFDNPVVMSVMSYIPFSAPVGMPMRLFLEQAAWWEPLLSLAILLLSTWLVLLLGARMYENSLLRTGTRVKLKEAIRG